MVNKESGVPSGSSPVKVIATAVSSFVDTDWSKVTGVLFQVHSVVWVSTVSVKVIAVPARVPAVLSNVSVYLMVSPGSALPSLSTSTEITPIILPVTGTTAGGTGCG